MTNPPPPDLKQFEKASARIDREIEALCRSGIPEKGVVSMLIGHAIKLAARTKAVDPATLCGVFNDLLSLYMAKADK
jgi:hypothetical protein